jgi:hypothetical protein
LLFLRASIGAFLKAGMFGIGPSNWLYDISTIVKLNISLYLKGMVPERLLCDRFNVSKYFHCPSIHGMVPSKS